MASAHVGAGGHMLLALLALSALGACGPKRVQRPGEEWLAAIEIEGNRAISDKDLREGLALRRVKEQGGAPDPYLVVVDGKRIRGQYVRRGFLEVDVRSRVERRGNATRVIYTVQEGPRARTRIMITGIPTSDPDLSLQQVRDALPLQDGAPFAYEPYDEAKQRMLRIIEDAGYAQAQLDAHVIADRANHEAIVHLDYEVGPKFRFGEVDVVGVDGELAEAIRARAAFDPGDTYSTAALAATQSRIYELRRFSMVRVVPVKTEGDVLGVRISVARSARNELVAGGGLGMDPATYEVRARTGYSRLGFPFPLTDFEVDLRPAYAMLRDRSGYEPRIRAIARLRRHDLFRPFVTGEAEGGWNYLAVEAYTSYGPRARLGIQSPLGLRALQLRVGWEIERLDFRQISSLIDPAEQMELGLAGTQRTGEYTQALSLDLRDNPIEPTFGAYAEVRVDEGTPYAGGEFSYVRVTPEARVYLPAPALPVVLAARARAGRVYGDLPVTKRYFSGGATLMRGFGERRLAPTAAAAVDGVMRTVPIGGAELFESNLEVRTRLTTVRGMGLGGVVFLDGGDVVDRGESVDLGNLHWAVGLGVRLYTIIGPVRADVGYRLNRRGFGEPEPGSRYAFHLSIGEAF